MRNFNTEEQDLLRIIINPQSEENLFVEVGGLFDKIAKDEKVVIKISKNIKIAFLLTKTYDNPIKDEDSLSEMREWYTKQSDKEYNLKRKFVVVFSLLNYLEINHLIYLYKLDNLPEKITNTAQFYLNSVLDRNSYPEKRVLFSGESFHYLFEKMYHSIIPSPELIEFVENKFKDEEQLRHKENIGYQKFAIILSLILGVTAVLDDVIKDWFGLNPKDEPVKQQIYIIDKGAVPDSIKKVIGEKLILNIKPSSKPVIVDTIKK